MHALTQAHETSLHVQSSEAVEKCKHPRMQPHCSLCDRCRSLERERAARNSSKVIAVFRKASRTELRVVPHRP